MNKDITTFEDLKNFAKNNGFVGTFIKVDSPYAYCQYCLGVTHPTCNVKVYYEMMVGQTRVWAYNSYCLEHTWIGIGTRKQPPNARMITAEEYSNRN